MDRQFFLGPLIGVFLGSVLGIAEPNFPVLGQVEFIPQKLGHSHPKSSGVVKQIFRQAGDRVTQGTPLASIESNVGVETYSLTAPMDGVIYEVSIVPGQTVGEDTLAYSIADPKGLQASLSVNPRDLSQFPVGQVLYPKGGGSVSLVVSHVSPVLDAKSRMGKVIAQFSSQEHPFIAGQYLVVWDKSDKSADKPDKPEEKAHGHNHTH